MDKQNGKTNNDTEQRILDAAVREFSQKGFDGARTASIAAEANVTHAMLHYYFRTKEKLFERIFRDKINSIINMVFAPMSVSGISFKEKIRNVVEAHFDYIMNNKDLPVFFVTTINSRPEAYKDVISELSSVASSRMQLLQDEFDKAAEAGEIKKTDVRLLMGDMVSLNIFPFLMYPMLMSVAGFGDDQFDEFMEIRKRESVETILKRIS